MKFYMLAIAFCISAIGTYCTSCSTPSQKVANAQDNVTQANKDLDAANKAYLADMENYRKETAAKIAANDKSIAEFNARIDNEKADAKADYKKKLAKLEEKNSDLKKKLDDYKADGRDKWEDFKKEFSHDMDALGTAFKDFTVKSGK